ncbi:hypothetical protein LINPERPRIM_LOCUS27663 [Linum perenne]
MFHYHSRTHSDNSSSQAIMGCQVPSCATPIGLESRRPNPYQGR